MFFRDLNFFVYSSYHCICREIKLRDGKGFEVPFEVQAAAMALSRNYMSLPVSDRIRAPTPSRRVTCTIRYIKSEDNDIHTTY